MQGKQRENEKTTELTYQSTMNQIAHLTNSELDEKLDETAAVSERAEMLLCCYLAAVRERQAFRDFGYSDIYDYAEVRFGFATRKTRYLISLGRKVGNLPKIREALMQGKLGWVKASRIATVANSDNEAMWLDSALALSVRELERRIKDGTDGLTSELRLPLNEDRRILWENALEIYRRRAGAELAPVEAFELMLAEVIAEWSHVTNDAVREESGPPDHSLESEEQRVETDDEPPEDFRGGDEVPPLPWTEETNIPRVEAGSPWSTESEAEKDFSTQPAYNAVRQSVLERDHWKCTYPGCHARRQLHVHHIRFRSRLGSDEPWNLTVVCDFHHKLIHREQVRVRGGAPMALEWTPPKLMREVLERRCNRRSVWTEDLSVREWTLDPLSSAV